jgi:hypothetical protein
MPPYNYNDTVVLTAIPAVFSKFNFFNPGGAIASITVIMDSSKTVIVNFSSSGAIFTYTDNGTDYPDLTDVIDPDTDQFDWARIFTYAWVWALGGWFFAMVLGVIGGALYVYYKSMEITVAYFIIILLIFGAVTQNIGYVVGIMVALIIGYLFYRLLHTKL